MHAPCGATGCKKIFTYKNYQVAFCGCYHLALNLLDQTRQMALCWKEGVLAVLPDGFDLDPMPPGSRIEWKSKGLIVRL